MKAISINLHKYQVETKKPATCTPNMYTVNNVNTTGRDLTLASVESNTQTSNNNSSNCKTKNDNSNDVNGHGRQKTNNRKSGSLFVVIMTKLTCVMIFALCSTLISIISVVVNVLSGYLFYTTIVAMLFGGLDIAINALCLILHWGFANSLYKKLCYWCHLRLLAKYQISIDDCNI